MRILESAIKRETIDNNLYWHSVYLNQRAQNTKEWAVKGKAEDGLSEVHRQRWLFSGLTWPSLLAYWRRRIMDPRV